MGTNKALIEVEGGPLVKSVVDLVLKVAPLVSLVGDPAQYAGLGLDVIPDKRSGFGPIAGIEAALAASNSEFNLIVACDMPSISEKLLEELFAAESDVSIPRHSGRKNEPICAVYRRAGLPTVVEAIESGTRKLQDLIGLLEQRGFAVRYVQVEDSAMFRNLNTPEDLRAWRNG